MTINDIPIDLEEKLQEEIIQNIDLTNPFYLKMIELEFLIPFNKEKTICLISQKAKAFGYKSILSDIFKKSYIDIQIEIKKEIEKKELIMLFDLAKKYNFSLHKEI